MTPIQIKEHVLNQVNAWQGCYWQGLAVPTLARTNSQ